MKKKIKVLLTASGSPGASTFIQWLKKNGEREIEIIGVDSNKHAVGQFFCDGFCVVPEANDPEYIVRIKKILEKEKPDIYFAASSYDVLVTARNKELIESYGAKVIVSDLKALEIASDKYKMYEQLKKETDLELPKYYYPKNLKEFKECAKKLGYPEKKVCFKPHYSKGSRGFRIIDDTISRKDLLLNYKPTSTFMSMREFEEIFAQEKEFPAFIIMEYVQGEHYDAMCLSMKGKELLTTVKTREKDRGGVIMEGELVNKPKIVETCRKILKAIPLSYCSGLQFIGDKIIEINPRVSTFIYQEDMIEPYLAIKLALGELREEEAKKYRDKIQFGRRMVRYFDQIFY